LQLVALEFELVQKYLWSHSVYKVVNGRRTFAARDAPLLAVASMLDMQKG
jgi:hypothetical protein